MEKMLVGCLLMLGQLLLVLPVGARERRPQDRFPSRGRRMHPQTALLESSCENKRADLVFIIDSSRSVNTHDYAKVKEFILDILQFLDIGPDITRVGLLQYGSTVKNEFSLKTFKRKSDVERAVKRMRHLSTGTMTGLAIQYALNIAFSEAEGARPLRENVPRVIMIVTDGRPQDSVAEVASKARNTGILIFAIGVGQVDLNTLKAIGSEPHKDHVFLVANFSQIESLTSVFQNKLCTVHMCSVLEHNCAHFCINTPGSYTCKCKQGYILGPDQKTCRIQDLCATEDHGCEQLCVNMLGSFVCHCYSGYTLAEDGKQCTAVDYCASENHRCEHECVNAEGSYLCRCHEGFALNVDKKTCSKIDYCASSDHGCQHECVNAQTSAFCRCLKGFMLNPDRKTCRRINYCALNKPGCEHECVNTEEGHYCRCRRGYTLDPNGKTCSRVDHCAQQDHGCEQLCLNTEESFVCQCSEGFLINDDLKTCSRADYCLLSNHGCEYSCVNTDKSFACQCPEGHVLRSDGKTCAKLDSCALGDHGCEHSCVSSEDSFVCRCFEGYVLRDDGKTCRREDVCQAVDHGCEHLCVNSGESYICKCLEGFRLAEDGKRCRRKDVCKSIQHGCEHICVNNGNSYLCRCSEGFVLAEDGRHCKRCTEGPIDLVFVIDGSKSLGEENFEIVKHFVTGIIDSLAVSPKAARVGLLQYSTQVRTEFTLKGFSSAKDMKKAVAHMKYMGKGSMTGLALKHMYERSFTQVEGARPLSTRVPRAAIVFRTMGAFSWWRQPSWMADNKRGRMTPSLPWLLSALTLLHLMMHVNGLKRGVQQDLKCTTNNMRVWDCSWPAPLGVSPGTVKDICIKDRPHSCHRLETTNVKIPALSPGDHEVTINYQNGFQSKFTLNEKDVSLVPDTPEILSLSADFSTSTLQLKWNDKGSALPYPSNATWEVKVLQNPRTEPVALVSLNTVLSGKDKGHHWNWTSELPLQCATHSVSIRWHIDYPRFSGYKEWSEWSPLKNISWTRNTETNVFPQDKVVLAGSNMTICCISTTKVLSGQIGNTFRPLIHLYGETVAIHILNIPVSENSGSNVIFSTVDDVYGTVVFAGYPPDVPQKLSCETHDLKEIICSWNPGRITGLVGPRNTEYTLFESISGKSAVFHRFEELANETYWLTLKMAPDQEIHNFTLTARNPLGQTESAIVINATERVALHVPISLKVKDVNSTVVTLSWYLPGNFTKINLVCQIEICKANSKKEVRNVTMRGAEDSTYHVAVDKLNPYTIYTFRVRCSSETFWKWSKWSNEKRYLTTEATPSKGPDTWREWSSDGKNLIIYWKPLPINEANGKILSYNVSCSSSEETQSLSEILDPQHKAEIKVNKNDYIISVVARNSAGSSPPSKIASMEIPNDDITVEQAVGIGNRIFLSWQHNPNMTCDYVIKWCNSSWSEPCLLDWIKVPSNSTGTVIESDQFQPGVRYNFYLYGCTNQGYQLLRSTIGYIEELAPIVAPNFTVEDTSADSILVKWDDIPVEELRGFLRGYLFYFQKGERDTPKTRSLETSHSDIKLKNITDISQKTLRIADLQGKTSYHLVLRAYTHGGLGPEKSMFVVTKENSVGLIIAILIPVAVAVIVGVVTSILCYRKREWIKETFYPDIPNPENCKALQFQKSVCEGSNALKTLEMNPCTPNHVEVLESRSIPPKIEDTEITSPVSERPGESSETDPENQAAVSYCPPIIEEEITNPAADEAGGASQVVYIDVQSMYQPQAKAEDEQDTDPVMVAGYKPQMRLPINPTAEDTTAEDEADKTAGYRPQANVNTWNLVSPDSPRSTDSNSEVVSFGSPCSINSRQFLIPPKDEDSPKSNGGGWSFTNFFQNKPND